MNKKNDQKIYFKALNISFSDLSFENSDLENRLRLFEESLYFKY